MNIALHDADNTNFPNLALMKLSAHYKAQGHSVEWFMPLNAGLYDVVFSSSVFTAAKEPISSPLVVKGGVGYGLFEDLPEEIEHTCPDYTLYHYLHRRKNLNRKTPVPEYSLGFLTRGCPNSCPWCIVPKKEGAVRAHADIKEFCRHKHVVLMDNNVLACDHGIDQIAKMAGMGLRVDFNQGLDSRLIDEPIARRLAVLGWFRPLRLACDHKAQMPAVERAVRLLRAAGVRPKEYFCYVLVKDVDDAHERVMFLSGLGVAPFAQAYRDFTQFNEPTEKQRLFCRWVNHKALFRSISWPEYWEQERVKRGLEHELSPSAVVVF